MNFGRILAELVVGGAHHEVGKIVNAFVEIWVIKAEGAMAPGGVGFHEGEQLVAQLVGHRAGEEGIDIIVHNVRSGEQFSIDAQIA